MSRLLLDLLHTPGHRENARRSKPVCINITEVANQYIVTHDTLAVGEEMKSFPCLAPPFEDCWLEFGWRGDKGTMYFGAHISALRLDTEALETHKTRQLFLWDAHTRQVANRANNNYLEHWNQPGWLVILETYSDQSIPYCVGVNYWILDDLGRWVMGESALVDLLRGSVMENILSAFNPVFGFAISLMHCKNVSTDDLPIPAKVAKKRRERGIPDLIIKTLNIHPLKARKDTRDNPDAPLDGQQEPAAHRRFHVCRGHFKDYRESGLFGRHGGIYWWSDHARGDLKQGAVVKGYKVKAE